MKQSYIILVFGFLFFSKHIFSFDIGKSLDTVNTVQNILNDCTSISTNAIKKLHDIPDVNQETKITTVKYFIYNVFLSYLKQVKCPDKNLNLLQKSAYCRTFNPIYNTNTVAFNKLRLLLNKDSSNQHFINVLQKEKIDANTLFCTLVQIHQKKFKEKEYSSILKNIEKMIDNNTSIILPKIPNYAENIIQEEIDLINQLLDRIITLSDDHQKILAPTFNSFEKQLLNSMPSSIIPYSAHNTPKAAMPSLGFKNHF